MWFAIKRDVIGGAACLLPLTVPSSLTGAAGTFVITQDIPGSLKVGACCLCTSSFMWMTLAMIDITRNEALKRHALATSCIAGAAFAFTFCNITDTSPGALAIATSINLLSTKYIFAPWYYKNFMI